jgi:hypothetical protein
MKPATVWLAMSPSEEDYDAEVFKSRPTFKTREGVPRDCGVDCCGWEKPPGNYYVGRRGAEPLTTLCQDGLRAAGIRIKPGKLLKLTISAEVVK